MGQEELTNGRRTMADKRERYRVGVGFDDESKEYVAGCPWNGCAVLRANKSKTHAINAVSGHMIAKHNTSPHDVYLGVDEK